MENKEKIFGLLLGPSAVGKSTIINKLFELAPDKYYYPSPHITRSLRPGEKDKIEVTDEQFEKTRSLGGFVVVNELYGVKYGTPTESIRESFRQNRIPILDWPLSRVRMLESGEYSLKTFYVAPLSLEEWKTRLTLSGRDKDSRGAQGLQELLHLQGINYDHPDIDHLIFNAENFPERAAASIHEILSKS